jgi:peptidoglycan/LPS O-acetylase OafA/YrhL
MDESSATMNRLDFLDGIRGAAAFWVLLAHCMMWGGWYGIPLPEPKIAVDVFMLVSGYLMFHLAEERAAQEPPGQWAAMFKFWTRRFFRIAPLYYLVLACAFLLGDSIRSGVATLQHAHLKQWVGTQYYPMPLDYSFRSLLMHVSFLFGLFPDYASSVGLPDWSIGLEMQFYAVFPFLWLLFCRLRPVCATLLIAGGWMLCNTLIVYPQFPEPSFLPLKLDLFLVGMLAASANRDLRARPLDAGIQIALAFLFASRHSGFVVAVAALMCLMISATEESEFLLWRARNIISPVLSNRLTRFMAEMSYGVYLTHGLIIGVLGGWLFSQHAVLALRPVFRTVLLTSITVIGSYGIAWVLHKWIEKPGIAYGRRRIAAMPEGLGRERATQQELTEATEKVEWGLAESEHRRDAPPVVLLAPPETISGKVAVKNVKKA